MRESGPKAQGPDGGKDHVGYRCYLLGPDDNIKKRIELHAGDDAAAIAESRRELENSTHAAAEVWFLSRKITTIARKRRR